MYDRACAVDRRADTRSRVRLSSGYVRIGLDIYLTCEFRKRNAKCVNSRRFLQGWLRLVSDEVTMESDLESHGTLKESIGSWIVTIELETTEWQVSKTNVSIDTVRWT